MGKMTMGRSDRVKFINDTTHVSEQRVIVPVEVIKEIIVTNTVEVPVEVIKTIEVEKIVEVPVEVIKLERIEVPIEVIKTVEVPIYIDRIVTKEVINIEEVLKLKNELKKQQHKSNLIKLGLVVMIVVSIIMGVM